MDRVEVAVVGAGVVGLAVARALALAGREVLVLEREASVGGGVSSRSSEVVHAGLYYTPGSLKARLCVRGKELVYAYSQRCGFEARACGKLVVATDAAQRPALDVMERKARANGVPVQRLDAAAARAMEPELHCVEALWSPTTGIVDSHGWMLALEAELERAGGAVALACLLVGAQPHAEGLVLRVRSGGLQGRGGTESELLARWVVNAAGLHACHVAHMLLGPRGADHIPRARYAKGSYFSLMGRSPFRHLVYPAPQDAWLGVHLTLDLGGQARFGPDLQWLDAEDPQQIDYGVDPGLALVFAESVRRFWPALPEGALRPAYSGVRPKIHGPGERAPDFLIQGPAQHGTAGVVNLLGIESPGLTSSMAIAEHVADLLLS